VRYARLNNNKAGSQFQYVSESGAVTDPEVYSNSNFFRGQADVGPGYVAFNHLTMLSYKSAAAAFGITSAPEWLETGTSAVILKTFAGYAVGFFDFEAAGIPIDGNVGVHAMLPKKIFIRASAP